MKVSELERNVGGLSKPSKMPGFAYGIPAAKCILGSILAKKKGSVCNSCYALKGMYVFPVVKAAQARRLESISRPEWVAWMVELLEKKYKRKKGADRVFRWHDSGDLQGMEHLSKIVEIAKALPSISFWLPTRELKMVSDWIQENGSWPKNLTVRVSMQMVGQAQLLEKDSLVWSTVGSGEGFSCPAREQGNECKNCRACWDAEIASVDYALH